MSIIELVDLLGLQVCVQIALFNECEQAIEKASTRHEIFKCHKKMAEISKQLIYLHEWIENYNLSPDMVKFKRTE